jgi:hypothetical protein
MWRRDEHFRIPFTMRGLEHPSYAHMGEVKNVHSVHEWIIEKVPCGGFYNLICGVQFK